MGDRLKIFAVIAVLGFMAGVIAQVTADYIIPWLMVVLPALVNIKWIVSGLAGATLPLVLISAWAYMSRNKDSR